MEPLATEPPPRPQGRSRTFIGWAVFISVTLHFALGPLFASARPTIVDRDPPPFFLPDPGAPKATPSPRPPTPAPTIRPEPRRAKPVAAHRTTIAKPPKTTAFAPSAPAAPRAPIGPISGEGMPGTAPGGPLDGLRSGDGGDGAAPATPMVPETPSPVPFPSKPACEKPEQDATVIAAVQPEYPAIAHDQGAAGTATVRVDLTAAGAVASATIYRSSGNAALDQSAIAAAKASRYRAAVQNCEPAAGSYLFVADFQSQ